MNILSKKIIPYFQPIVAIDTGEIYSYEVLGRYIDDDGSVKSLGGFFSDPAVSSEDALEVDRIVRRLALEQYAAEKTDKHLFINLRLEWIAYFADKLEEIPTLLWAKELGIDLTKLVFEITEEEFNTENKILEKVIGHYKRFGCHIAIDDYGKQASNIDRLAMLQPDIIKINMEYIHKSEHSLHYREYLNAIASFAKNVGIEVLHEGIETKKQLDICINSKGRYYQGYLLAKPQPFMADAAVNFDVFSSSANSSIISLHERSDYYNSQLKFWDQKIEKFLDENNCKNFQGDLNEFFAKLLQPAAEPIKRIYLCNKLGEQISYNIEMVSGKVVWNDYKQRNWAWRGFFQEAMFMLGTGMKSHLSGVYRDSTTKEEILTYTYAVNTDLYLFIDIYQSSTPRINASSIG